MLNFGKITRFFTALIVGLAMSAMAVRAEITINVTGGRVEPLPIAITDMLGSDLGAKISSVIAADLKRSGFFNPLDKATFTQQITDPNVAPTFDSWKVINAQALVMGQVQSVGGGKISASFRLWDVFGAEQVVGQQFTATEANWRRVAHIIADAIYEALTGEKGYFDTRVVFVDESGPKTKRKKRLTIMDQDGANVRYLTTGSDLVLTPRFSPTAQELTYMSFGNGQPRVYLLNIETGQREIVGNFPGMTFSPHFSPDGQRVIMSLQQNGNANIYTMDLRSGATSRMTNSAAIDTSPSYSPDGRRIVFESDRGGRQQLYVMNADGSGAKRISFGKGSYSTPVWSPKGDFIAFTKQNKGKFIIGVMKPDGSGERVLSEGFHNEGPTWAPNGRVLMFFRDVPGASGGPQLWSVDVSGYNEQRVQTPSFASDPAWSPRIN